MSKSKIGKVKAKARALLEGFSDIGSVLHDTSSEISRVLSIYRSPSSAEYFYMHVAVQNLSVPFLDAVPLGMGHRLKAPNGSESWSTSLSEEHLAAAIRGKAFGFWQNAANHAWIVETQKDTLFSPAGFRSLENRFYSALHLGKAAVAIDSLVKIKQRFDSGNRFVSAAIANMETLLELSRSGAVEDIQAVLAENRARNLESYRR